MLFNSQSNKLFEVHALYPGYQKKKKVYVSLPFIVMPSIGAFMIPTRAHAHTLFFSFLERARRARMREERQWLMANGKFVPEELKVGLGKEEEAVESETERRPNSRSKQVNEEVGLEDRDEDLYTGMYKGT